jgi:hypothetical protein
MGGTKEWRVLTVAALALLSVLAVGLGRAVKSDPADPGPTSPQAGPDWTRVFDAEGSLRQPFRAPMLGVTDAVFVEDRISGGAIVDISALDRAAGPADSYVYNGPVAAPHDLGNAYVLARIEGIDLMLDVRVERLTGDGASESYVEIEFNHDIVGVTSGHRFPIVSPEGGVLPGYKLHWPFRGERTTGDFLVRTNLVGPMVSSVEFKGWGEVDGILGYHTVEAGENLADEACFGISMFYAICSGSLASAGQSPAFIANGDPEQTYAPDSYFEFSVNVGRLVGLNPDFTTVQVSSPHDIAFGTFKAFGRFASPSPEMGNSPTGRHPDEE